MGDNLALLDRNGVRMPMQWNDQHNAEFSTANRLYAPLSDTLVNVVQQMEIHNLSAQVHPIESVDLLQGGIDLLTDSRITYPFNPINSCG
ncbi:MAG TPA: hypothetical protein VLG46_05885 [Anaerolineae bacterium]|nr:hypothetical protein [Anaerolineae bacterium]